MRRRVASCGNHAVSVRIIPVIFGSPLVTIFVPWLRLTWKRRPRTWPTPKPNDGLEVSTTTIKPSYPWMITRVPCTVPWWHRKCIGMNLYLRNLQNKSPHLRYLHLWDIYIHERPPPPRVAFASRNRRRTRRRRKGVRRSFRMSKWNFEHNDLHWQWSSPRLNAFYVLWREMRQDLADNKTLHRAFYTGLEGSLHHGTVKRVEPLL